MFKRISLFLITNLAIIFVLRIVLKLLDTELLYGQLRAENQEG